MAKKTYKFPTTPGGCVDRIWQLDAQMKSLKDQLKVLEEERSKLAEHTQETFKKSDLTSAKTKLARVEFKPKRKWNVIDWDKFWAHIVKTKSFDLMERRPSQKAIEERVQDKKKVPGTEAYDFFYMSVTEKK